MSEEKKKKGGLKLGSKVWVRDIDTQNPDVFVIATLKGIAGANAQIEMADGQKFETDLFFPANPPGQDFNDHTALVYLSDAALLENSRIRYAKDEIYTFVGPILISVNPFKYIEKLYRPELMAECRRFAPGHPDRPAHTFSMAEAAYQQLAKQKHSQSLVVSGESGAGKTEVNKQCMNYLVWRACDETSDLATRILESNPVLEGLGNAKTVRNNNSSRFGKFVTMRFDDKPPNERNPKLVGAEVQTFLLEKSRVVATTASGERNYHVFYHIVKGSGYLPSTEPENFRLLSRSGTTTIPRVDDLEEYHGIVRALADVGIDKTEIREIEAAIAGILALGNLEFGDEENDAHAYVSDFDMMSIGADMLGSTPPLMETALLKATLKVSKDESYTIELDPIKAAQGRDAFCKAIYQRIFDHLVKRVNKSLGESMALDEGSGSLRFIGLLDVFGFEIFEINSFEQLCINFANEKLQNFFLRSVFKAEELAYKNDGIKWEPIPYTDNSNIIEICEGKEKGVFPSLDSVCKAPKATDETLANQLHENHGKSKILCRPKAAKEKGGKKGITDKEGFIMKHFAGDVTYAVANWLDKNNDKLSEDYEKHLTLSSKELIKKHLIKQEEEAPKGGKGKGKPKAAQTVSRAFLGSLKKLLDALESTEAHFIRCIKPNNELKPNLLYGAFVLTQLKCSGTLEAVELMQKGYPSRIPYSAIHERYKVYMPDFVQALPPSEFVEAIALAWGVQKEDYALGMYKIFMRAGKAAFLEELKDAPLDEMIPIIVKKIEEFQKKKDAKKMIERRLLLWIWRRRIRKLREIKRKNDEMLARKAAAKKALRGKILGDLRKTKAKKAKEEAKAIEQQLDGDQIKDVLANLPSKNDAPAKMSSLSYGPRVVSKRVPIDPNDKSAFTINIPQGAKSIIKQAIEEYKSTNDMGPDELFNYEDIAHSGHVLMKVVDLVKDKGGKKKKKEEWVLEYFILLQTKHIVHFQPNTGMVDPFTKTIRGKAIDLMQATIGSTEEEAVDIPEKLLEGFSVDTLSDGFEIRTARQVYQLKPKETSAESWIEAITEVMFDDGDAGAGDEENRDYNDFLTGYNDVTQGAEAGNNPDFVDGVAA